MMTNRPPSSSTSNSVRVITAIAGQRAAERQRTGVTHEDLGRRRVPPQEAEQRAGQRGRHHGEVVRIADLVTLGEPGAVAQLWLNCQMQISV